MDIKLAANSETQLFQLFDNLGVEFVCIQVLLPTTMPFQQFLHHHGVYQAMRILLFDQPFQNSERHILHNWINLQKKLSKMNEIFL